MARLTIEQGTDRAITVTDIVDADGQPLDVTGWTVHAVARRDSVHGEVVAEWHTTPGGDQAQADADGPTIILHIPHALSSAWTWTRAILQAEMTEPGEGGRRERIIPTTWLHLDREVVR